MRKGVLASCAVAVIVSVVAVCFSTWSGFGCWRAYVVMQNLRLADDASTPAKKAEYLTRFLTEVGQMPLPEHAAFVFKTPRNRVAEQVAVLDSLRQRCADLVGIDQSSMGYAVGMQQISGQEFDHALAECGAIMRYGMRVSQGWWRYYGWPLAWVLTVAAWIAFGVRYSASRY